MDCWTGTAKTLPLRFIRPHRWPPDLGRRQAWGIAWQGIPALRSRSLGRTIWKRGTGYHVRSRDEAKMMCFKSFGEHIASRDPDRQTAEIHIRIALMNRFKARGNADIERVP